jgi:hypothetical protein
MSVVELIPLQPPIGIVGRQTGDGFTPNEAQARIVMAVSRIFRHP